MNKKNYERAITDFNEAIRLDANDPQGYTCRGGAYLEKKDYDRAIIDFNKAIGLDAKDALAYDQLAWVRATCPKDGMRNGKKDAGVRQEGM